VKDQYFHYLKQSRPAASSETASDTTPAKFDLSIDKFLLGTFEVDNLHVVGERRSPFWALNIDSKLMAGKVLVPEDDRPIALDLDYLRIAGQQGDRPPPGNDTLYYDELAHSGGTSVGDVREVALRESVLADIDLTRALALDFSAQEFSLGEANYGSWNFKLRPIDGGVVIHSIRATVKGMQIGNEKNGAEFTWLKNENGQSSQFTGSIAAKNLADVFEAWGQEKLMVSESAAIDIDAQWPGAPDQVTIKTVKGLVSLDVLKGSFTRGAGSDENALLRLLALFNFDTIIRRLRLDFSDLAAQGFSYDKVHGNLDFENGTIFLSDPLIVESSSSYVQLAGTIDVIDEKLDSEMVVTLPVASNMAVATAVVVGLPAALGVYVMSKLFKKQVDRASSINIEVKGKWEDPKIKVKKIFDIDAANRRGKEIKEKNSSRPLDTTSVP